MTFELQLASDASRELQAPGSEERTEERPAYARSLRLTNDELRAARRGLRKDQRADCCVVALPTFGVINLAYINLDFEKFHIWQTYLIK